MEVRDELLGETTTTNISNNNNNNNNNTNITNNNEKPNEVQQNTTVTNEKESKKEEGEVEVIEGVEPNTNRYYKAGPTVEPKKSGKKMKKKGGSGGGKTKTKGSVYRDADGSSRIEKTNNVKGSVTVIGEGTVFSEKALPPVAKSVVYLYYYYFY